MEEEWRLGLGGQMARREHERSEHVDGALPSGIMGLPKVEITRSLSMLLVLLLAGIMRSPEVGTTRSLSMLMALCPWYGVLMALDPFGGMLTALCPCGSKRTVLCPFWSVMLALCPMVGANEAQTS